MKTPSYYVPYLGLVVFAKASSTSADFLRFDDKRIIIKHDLIKLVDGTSRVDIKKIIKLETDIHHLQKENDITYQGKKYSLDELVDLEQKAKLKNPRAHQVANQFKHTLLEAITKFKDVSAPYLKEARGFKSQMCVLMKKWSEQRKIKSILNEWANQQDGEEIEQLKKLATSLADLNKLLSDLSIFLKDFRHSCKTSWRDYLKKLKDAKQDKEEL
jgi:hypothetical protein